MPPTEHSIRILHLEDSPRDAELIHDLLTTADHSFDIVLATNRSEFERALSRSTFQLVVCDFQLRDFDGMAALGLVRARDANLPVVVVSGAMDVAEAVACLKAGATDYLFKHSLDRLPSAVRRALEEAATRRDLQIQEAALRFLSTQLLSLPDDQVFTAALGHLAELLGCDTALLGEIDPTQLGLIRTLAVVDTRQPLPNFSYPACGSPCADLPQAGVLVIQKDLGAKYPGNPFAREKGLVSYAGVAVCDTTSRRVGHIGVMGRRPIQNPATAEAVLKLFAIALGAILDRQRNAKRFRDLFEFSPDAALMSNRDGVITMANQKAGSMFGYHAPELVGKSVDVLIPFANSQARGGHPRPLFHTQTPGPIQNQASNPCGLRKNGEKFPAEINLQLIDTDAGPMVAASIRDISDRLRMEEEMREALAVLDLTADAVLIYEQESWRFTYVNNGAAQQLGYSREELLRMSVLDINSGLSQKAFRQLLAPLATGAKPVLRLGMTHSRKDGETLPVEVNIQRVASPGVRDCYVSIARDITERMRAERQMLRTQRLESIGTLASGVAHDLNNALTPILMSVEMLKAEYPKSCRALDIVEISAKRGADMVRQLLTFARGVEGERLLVEPERLLGEMRDIIKSTFPKNILLESEIAPNLGTILGDVTQLHQVLLNLCVNARDAMPKGGTLTLQAENAEVDATYAASAPGAKPGRYVVWRVKDTGVGIPQKIQERVFEPFFTTKSMDKGTGLGLSTVVGIVKSHGGFLRLYSVVGQGTTFAVYLPVSSAAAESTPQLDTRERRFRGNGETVLVVDDEANVREVMRGVLSPLNLKVLTATDGTDALLKVADNRESLRLVITDCHMPHMDGLSFARVLKHMAPNAKIIVTSGRFGERELAEFNAVGVDSFLEKPFTQAKLELSLQASLGTHSHTR